jgi:hypothetical protein
MAGTSSTTLTLGPATLDDVPALTEIWFAAFTDPSLRYYWPDTPLVRQWWDEANAHDMRHKSETARYVKVVDASTGRIAAFAKWDLAMPAERGRRYPPWCADQPSEECDRFFEREEKERIRVMGDERHYCGCCRSCHRAYNSNMTLTDDE